MPNPDKKTILETRIKKFALDVVRIVKALPKTEENRIYGKQIIRSSSSIGANYAEAVYAHTRQEFLHCLNISRRETNESLYWLEMIYNVNINFKKELEILMDECTQILKIFISSVKTTKLNLENNK